MLVADQDSGNRFRDSSLPERGRWEEAFSKVRELSLAGTFLSWNEVSVILSHLATGC